MSSKPLCGIDEAGRGCIAGSLVMAGVILEKPVDGLMDSKKLSQKRREELYDKIIKNSIYHIISFSAKEVDELGLSKCLHNGLLSIKEHIDADYLFDGNSTFGVEGIDTMVKADDKIQEVSAASILAKVTRDNEMKRFAIQFPMYGFEKHKGYGTKAHTEALVKYGRCVVHRTTFKVKGLP